MAGNKEAISKRGLNPLNHNLLLLNLLRRTMLQYDKERETKKQLLTIEKLQLVQNTIFTGEAQTPEGNLQRSNLDFNHRYASIFIDKIVGHSDLELARSRNKHHSQCGMSAKKPIKQVKKVTFAGEIVKIGNTHEIGMDLLTQVCCCNAELDLIAEIKLLKKEQEHHNMVHTYILLLKKKTNEKTCTITDLKVVIQALKVGADGRIPWVKKDLIELYERIKLRHNNFILQYNDGAVNKSSG